jgi:hypothetical protein
MGCCENTQAYKQFYAIPLPPEEVVTNTPSQRERGPPKKRCKT